MHVFYNYASVGGATRHTVVVLCVSLCLGGRSHGAYCNRAVCHSVCYTILAAHAGRQALKLAMQVEIDIISVVN